MRAGRWGKDEGSGKRSPGLGGADDRAGQTGSLKGLVFDARCMQVTTTPLLPGDAMRPTPQPPALAQAPAQLHWE